MIVMVYVIVKYVNGIFVVINLNANFVENLKILTAMFSANTKN